MTPSELIQAHHRQRKAVIYIRQSTPHQLLSHQESLRLQYALQDRAQALGWSLEQIEVIDQDLGISGSHSHNRNGFQQLLAETALGQIGLILSIEVTRLCRNFSDWYPLLDICAYQQCLIADSEGVYDPGDPNGRLLLGIKGQLSELELHAIRHRLTAGLLNKAKRGELALPLPTGFIRDEQGVVHKDPHQQVQHCIDLIFKQFLRLRSANKVFRWLLDHQIQIPRRNRHGDLQWKLPAVGAIISILKNPAYAGAFVYGKRDYRQTTAEGHRKVTFLSQDQWKIIVKDKYPAYISWETYEWIQQTMTENYAEYRRRHSRGFPRSGDALLQGIVYCGQCGHQMKLLYKPNPRYICDFFKHQHGAPTCQLLLSAPLDQAVVQAFFEAMSPIELDAYDHLVAHQQQQIQDLQKVHHQQLQRLEYQANLAQRRYNHADPENRLVTAELEKRWEEALRELHQAQETLAQKAEVPQLPDLPKNFKEALVDIGSQMPQLWENFVNLPTQKKLLRCLIDKVVLQRSSKGTVIVRIVWQGGSSSRLEVPLAVGSLQALDFAEEMEQLIIQWTHRGDSDQQIAQQLTEQGFHSPSHPTVLVSTVQRIRMKYKLHRKNCYSKPIRVPGYLTVTQVAQKLGVEPYWVHYRIKNGKIGVRKDTQVGVYLFPDTSDTMIRLKQLKEGNLVSLDFNGFSEKMDSHNLNS